MQESRVEEVSTHLNTLIDVQPEQAVALLERLFSSPRSRPFSDQERQLLARGQTQVLAELAMTMWGEGERTVLLIHGWQQNRASLGPFVDPLVEAGFRVVAFDAPAHGDSAGERAHPTVYTEKIHEVGQLLGPLQGVVAHSMGGGSAVMALSRGLLADKVALLAPAVDWGYQIRLFTKTLGLNEKLTERFVQQQQENAGLGDRETNARLFAEHLDIPARVYHDPEDKQVLIEDSQALLHYWGRAELIRVADVGHGRLLRSETVISHVTDFLSS